MKVLLNGWSAFKAEYCIFKEKCIKFKIIFLRLNIISENLSVLCLVEMSILLQFHKFYVHTAILVSFRLDAILVYHVMRNWVSTST
jgi:hypothetical protein